MFLRFQRFFQSVYIFSNFLSSLILSSNLHWNSTRHSLYNFSCDCDDFSQKVFLNSKSRMQSFSWYVKDFCEVDLKYKIFAQFTSNHSMISLKIQILHLDQIDFDKRSHESDFAIFVNAEENWFHFAINVKIHESADWSDICFKEKAFVVKTQFLIQLSLSLKLIFQWS
jgi:ribosomal protein L20A (L18A)